jgi:PTS system nitrogen regulatory IIA component
MHLSDLLHEDALLIDLASRGKTAVLAELAGPIAGKLGVGTQRLTDILLERERLGSTGIGDGIGIPHGKLKGMTEALLVFGRSRLGVPFDALDGKPVHLFFLLLTPEDAPGLHLQLLARISRMLKGSGFREKLLRAPDRDSILRLIAEEDGDH